MKKLAFVLLSFLSLHAFSAYPNLVGSFQEVTPGHPTSGLVEIIEHDQLGNFIVLQDDFETVPGPALYVVLHKSDNPQSYTPDNSVMIGVLKDAKGKQIYEIPAGVDLTQFNAVIIWCKEFDVTFGSALFR